VLEFNWGMFWAVLAALAVRGSFKHVWRMVLIAVNQDIKREITLRDIWERM
jgi:hypothetical protein